MSTTLDINRTSSFNTTPDINRTPSIVDSRNIDTSHKGITCKELVKRALTASTVATLAVSIFFVGVSGLAIATGLFLGLCFVHAIPLAICAGTTITLLHCFYVAGGILAVGAISLVAAGALGAVGGVSHLACYCMFHDKDKMMAGNSNRLTS